MKSKYEKNDLIEFLDKNPMEMREFMDAYWRLNPLVRLIIRIRAAMPWS